MTGEEEIFYDLDSKRPQSWEKYEKDIMFLLARNDELQREKEKMQAVVDAARNLKLTILAKRKPEDYVHTFATCDKTNDLVVALQALDAKEQGDAK